jgi:hypothetical protein
MSAKSKSSVISILSSFSAGRRNRRIVRTAQILVNDCIRNVSRARQEIDKFKGKVLIYLEFHFAGT